MIDFFKRLYRFRNTEKRTSLIHKRKLISKIRSSNKLLRSKFRESYKIAGIDLFHFLEYYIENYSGVADVYPDINTTKNILAQIKIGDFIKFKNGQQLEFRIKRNRVFICSENDEVIIPCLPLVYDEYNGTFQIEPLLLNHESVEVTKGQRSYVGNGIRFDYNTYGYLNEFLKSKKLINSINTDQLANALSRTLYKHFSQNVLTEVISLMDFSEEERIELHFKHHLISYQSYLLLVHYGFRKYDVNFFVELLLNSLQGRSHATFHFRFVKSSRDYLPLAKVREELINHFSNFDLINQFFKIPELIKEIEKGVGGKLKSGYEILRLADIHFYYVKEEYPSFSIVFISDSLRKNSKKYKLHQFLKEYKEELKHKARELENDIRRKQGFTSVGMYIKESFLYHKIKDELKEYKVVPQGSPEWLGKQRIDIYIPELNIGIEYQGEQHFIPIEFFGGESSLKRNQKRDRIKRELCDENGCKLFYINYFDNIEHKADEIIKKIRSSI